jgi:PRTRC genetic system protein C
MKVTQLTREFSYNGMKLPDPNPALSVEQAVRSMAAAYPEFTTAKIEPPTTVTGTNGERIEVYRIKPVVGEKG